MIFGLGKRPQLSVADFRTLSQAFEDLKKDCPGGAFMFARSLAECVAHIKNAKVQDWPVKAVLKELVDETSRTFGLDKGTRMLAVQSMQRVNRSQVAREEESAMEKIIFGIVTEGERYRDVNQRDHSPPANVTQCEFLKLHQTNCLADYLEKGGFNDPGHEALESRDTFIAVFDIMAEWQDGPLKRHLSEIDQWTKA